MGCCSGSSSDASIGGDQCSVENHSKINLNNYTYFPGAIKQTDYTKSQVRTGWASELDRKRNISQTVYYNPSYVVLANHGNDKSNLRSGGSIFSAAFSNNLKRKMVEPEYESITTIRNRKANKNSENKKRNYFCSNQK